MTSQRVFVLRPVLGAGLAAGVAWLATGAAFPIIVAAMAGAALGAWAVTPEAKAAVGVSLLPQGGGTDRRPRDDVPEDGIGHRLLQALPIGTILIGPNKGIRFINAEAVKTFGIRDAQGLPVSALRVRKLLDLIDQAFARPGGLSCEFSLARKDDLALRALAERIEEGDEYCVLVTIEDLTKERVAHDLHRDFVANASHELKTPLAAVAGIIETLQGHAKDDPDAAERFLKIMAAQASRMNRLVEDLLSLNRIEVNERVQPTEQIDVHGTIKDVIETLYPFAESQQVVIRDQRPNKRLPILADRNELFQLFQNVIDNAIKYGGPGSRVDISMRNEPERQPGMIGIAICDQGPGIAREHIPRLTERFYRVSVSRSREKGGTGLGLAIVKHILNRHRGRLEIESTLGEGACFVVWLPRA